MSASLVGSEMCIRDRCEARRLRRPPLESRASNFGRLRAAEKAVWPVGRAGTATSQAGVWVLANCDQGAEW
eukprot:9292576-Alexandrium_andersonii.AAC.1